MDDAGKAHTRREYLKVSAINPDTGKTIIVQISYDRLHNIAKRGKGEIECARYTVPYILQHPTAIFKGLCLEEDEDARGYGWRCYCGIPEHDYSLDGQELPPRSNKVFLVFVNDELVAYNWVWVKCDEFHNELPIDYKTRFKEKLL